MSLSYALIHPQPLKLSVTLVHSQPMKLSATMIHSTALKPSPELIHSHTMKLSAVMVIHTANSVVLYNLYVPADGQTHKALPEAVQTPTPMPRGANAPKISSSHIGRNAAKYALEAISRWSKLCRRLCSCRY